MIVTNVRWDAVDAMAANDECCSLRTAKACGPDTPRLVSSSREAKLPGDDGGKKAWSPRRARYKPVNRRAGKAGLPPLNLYARVHFYPITGHTGPRVQRAPGLPCALLL